MRTSWPMNPDVFQTALDSTFAFIGRRLFHVAIEFSALNCVAKMPNLSAISRRPKQPITNLGPSARSSCQQTRKVHALNLQKFVNSAEPDSRNHILREKGTLLSHEFSLTVHFFTCQ